MWKKCLLLLCFCVAFSCRSNAQEHAIHDAPAAASTTQAQGALNGNDLATPTWPACFNNGTMAALSSTQPADCKITGTIDVNVVVDATRGPKNFTAPKAISNKLFSMGIDDRTRGDYMPVLNANYVKYLKALKPAMLRFPAGYNGQHYIWGSVDSDTTMTPKLLDAFIALCRAVGAEPYLAVNIETGSIDDALAMLRYVNVTKNYGVKWWQIGNEPNLSGTYPSEGIDHYISLYRQFRAAMLAVDPSLKFVAIESYTGEGLNYNETQPNWFNPFLAQVTAGGADAFAFHYYPLTSSASYTYPNSSIVPSIAHLLQEDATDWPPSALNYPDKIMPYLRQQMAANNSVAEVWVDEFAEDSGSLLNGVGYSDVMLGALWSADSMGRYADQGIDAIFHFIFKAIGTNTTFGYTLIDANDAPRPEYFTYWLLANQFGDSMVNTTSDKMAQVAAHASIRAADCSLRVMLVNKATTPQAVRLTLKGYAPVSSSQFNLVGDGYQSANVALNGMRLGDIAVDKADAVAQAPAQACVDNVVNLQAFSVNVLVFKKTRI